MNTYQRILAAAALIGAAGAGLARAQNTTAAVTPGVGNATVAAAPARMMATRLDPQPTPGAATLPAGTGVLLSGYGQQAQGGLILAYFATGTLGDALTAGALSGADARRQADSYLTLATSARDDLKRVRAAYALEVADLDQLDKLNAAYGDVIPMITAVQRLADGPRDAANRAAFQAARRQAFATLGALFHWQ